MIQVTINNCGEKYTISLPDRNLFWKQISELTEEHKDGRILLFLYEDYSGVEATYWTNKTIKWGKNKSKEGGWVYIDPHNELYVAI